MCARKGCAREREARERGVRGRGARKKMCEGEVRGRGARRRCERGDGDTGERCERCEEKVRIMLKVPKWWRQSRCTCTARCGRPVLGWARDHDIIAAWSRLPGVAHAGLSPLLAELGRPRIGESRWCSGGLHCPMGNGGRKCLGAKLAASVASLTSLMI